MADSTNLNGRKRRSEDQSSGTSSDGQPEKKMTPAGRPKRRCTSNQKKYVESDEIRPADEEDPDYEEPAASPPKTVSPKKVVQKSSGNGILVYDKSTNKAEMKSAVNEAKTIYRWMDHDEDTGKIRCKICMAANLKKWFILAGDNVANLMDSLRLHEASEEHRRSSKADGGKNSVLNSNSPASQRAAAALSSRAKEPGKTVIAMPAFRNPAYHSSEAEVVMRDVYCIPMECIDPIPLPSTQLRNLLARHGLKGRVNFAADLTPAKLREDISKAFSRTFSLRSQELLQFDYLSLSADKTELTRPQKMLHFDAKTVLSFAGDEPVYVLLKQKSPMPNLDWKQLLFQQTQLRTLGDDEYKEVMLSVMHRLSSGKHKKDAAEDQKKLVESLIADYKLNNYHQLVYIGNEFDQLVLFVDKRRHEAFQTGHGKNHVDLQSTFNNIFRHYYWNGIEDWVTFQFQNCASCLRKHGPRALCAQTVSVSQATSKSSEKTSGSPQVAVFSAPKPQAEQAAAKNKSPPQKKGALMPFIKAEKNDELLPPEDPEDEDDTDTDEEEEQKTIDSAHCMESMQAMYLLQQSGKFCDFEVILIPAKDNDIDKPTTFNVHRVVFAVISDRISKMSAGKIKLGGKVSSKAMNRIIEYAYNGCIAGIRELQKADVARISSTALALDVKIDHYLRKERPDFTKSSAKIQIMQKNAAKTKSTDKRPVVKTEPTDLNGV